MGEEGVWAASAPAQEARLEIPDFAHGERKPAWNGYPTHAILQHFAGGLLQSYSRRLALLF
jgi:hypothetical protein